VRVRRFRGVDQLPERGKVHDGGLSQLWFPLQKPLLLDGFEVFLDDSILVRNLLNRMVRGRFLESPAGKLIGR
jgi:hypothetical protein